MAVLLHDRLDDGGDVVGVVQVDALGGGIAQLLDVVRSFTGKVRERALGTEVSDALNPAQQVIAKVRRLCYTRNGVSILKRPCNS